MENQNMNLQEDRGHRIAILSAIRSDISEAELREFLSDYHDHDIAAVFDVLTSEELDRLHRALGTEAMSDVISFAQDAGEILSEMDTEEAAALIEQMDADDAQEILDELDDSIRNEVLELIDEDMKDHIELIDSYDEDEFGSVMSTNFIVIGRELTVKQAMRTLIAEAPDHDNIYTLFVTDHDIFYGTIDLKELIVARSDRPLEELIYKAFPFVYDKESISENIERVRGYSENLIPVLSSERHLLGVITSQDITELVDTERSDDYAKLAAMSSEEEKDDTIFSSMRKRAPWLIALLFLGLAVSAAVGLFEGVVKELPLIVCFQSLILGMAGNVGTQSLAVTVRALGACESENKKWIGFIFKEGGIALLNGIFIGGGSVLIVGAYLLLLGGYAAATAFGTALCVGLALCFAMMIAGFTGSLIPAMFARLGIDPAVASGPLITTVNDLVAVFSYYGLAWILLL